METSRTRLDRILIVVEQRIRPDGSYPGLDLKHMEGSLRYSGMVDNIDVLYYRDYLPCCDEALLNYCFEKKPQAVLLSLQNMSVREGGPTPDAIGKITQQLGIPTVMFWWDIHLDHVAEVLVRYLHSVTLNIIMGADASTHNALPLQETNYVYAPITFDESLFNIPEGARDIPVGFLGSLSRSRLQWIAGLKKFGISSYTGGGWGQAGWMSYEEYLRLISRLKIAPNFSSLGAREYDPVVMSEKGRFWETLYWLMPRLKTWFLALAKNPAKSKLITPVFKNTVAALSEKPRYMVRARVWEAMWCRTFLLEEDNPVTSLYFEPYVDYVPFTTLKDLVDKIRYYLENDEERDRIRRHGRATVEKYHNARIHWENLFETIGIQSDTQYHHHPGEIWNKAYFDNWYLSHPSILNQVNLSSKR